MLYRMKRSTVRPQGPGRCRDVARTLRLERLRYPEVQIVFADYRKYAEEWTYRYLAAAYTDAV